MSFGTESTIEPCSNLDNGAVDTNGRSCTNYDGRGVCGGFFDTGVFKVQEMCCECGGGTHYFPTVGSCSSTEGSARNHWGEDCHDYQNDADWCGNNPFSPRFTGDDGDFISR